MINSDYLPKQALINGANSMHLLACDRSTLFGDSIFTTIKISSGQLVLFDQHVARLEHDARQLKIRYPGAAIVKHDIDQLVLKDIENGCLRYTISRGIGPRGYGFVETQDSTRIALVYAFSDNPKWRSGVKLRLCQTRLGHQPALAGLKHGNRLEQILARSEWSGDQFDEGLMFDLDDHVIEGTMSNLFIFDNETLITPQLDYCGVRGVMRQQVLTIAKEMGLPVLEKPISRAHLLRSSSGFITNALIGLAPIIRLEQTPWEVCSVFADFLDYIEQHHPLN